MKEPTDLEIKKCTIDNLEEIIHIGTETYLTTFESFCSQSVMQEYLKEAFSKDRIKTELNNPNSSFFFAYLENVVVGYVKINTNEAQTDLRNENGLEIERIYVRNNYKGRGVGKSC